MSTCSGHPILVFNSGSSSLKFGVFEDVDGEEQALLSGSADGPRRGDGALKVKRADGTVLVEEEHTSESADQAMEWIAQVLAGELRDGLSAVGHRVVHGGPKLREHQVVTPDVQRELEAATPFAPLHIPEAMRILRKAEELYPKVPQVACFDTVFHNTMPPRATHLPIPERYFVAGVQRYGFHGLSCESVMHRLGADVPRRVVIAHLGGGSSVTAVEVGRSIDTSMGMSPTGGVPMSTRSGDLDPGVLIYILRTEGLTADALEHFVDHECGMTGLAGEGNMRALEARTDDSARLAMEMFTTDVRKTVAGYAGLMVGLDLLVFTGGIGFGSAAVREQVTAGLGFLGARIEVLEAQEELMIARHARRLVGA